MGWVRGSEAGSAVISHRRELIVLAMAAMAMPLIDWAWTSLHGNFNDFHDYWLAGKLVLTGHSPYDIAALRDLAHTEHLSFLVGGGYSYPLPFAVFMVPFALLPFQLGLEIFLGLSIVAFGLTVAGWIGWAHGWEAGLARRRLALALAAGFCPPVIGSVGNGQANLILMPLLAGGLAMTIAATDRGRRAGGGVLFGLVAIVKLVPGVVVVPFMLARRWGAAAGTVAGALGALVAASLMAPWAADSSGGLGKLFESDSYFTNQSFNGFVSRLVNASDRTLPPFPHAFDPGLPMMALTAAFGLVTVALLWRAGDRLRTSRGLALGLAMALVAGVIGAPKNSFWNGAFALPAVGLLLAFDVPDLHLSRLGRTDLLLLAFWLGASILWAVLWTSPPPKAAGLPALTTLLQSSGLYGLLALWWLMARRLFADGNAAAGQVHVAAGGAEPIQSAGTIS